MRTILVSDDAYKKVMAKRREMEKREGRVVRMADALDELLKGEEADEDQDR